MRNIAIFLSLASLVLLAACYSEIGTNPIPAPKPPQPTPSPQALTFPDDDGTHDVPIEWWYYNGHLEDEEGSEYSFHFVVFQTQIDDATTRFEFGQAGITDVGVGVHVHLSSDAVGSIESAISGDGSGILDLNLGDFALSINSNGVHELKASDQLAGTSLNIHLQASKTVMLHEGIGWMDWPFGWTYYYSYPRMEAHGTITIDGDESEVAGKVWFDHQWGDFFVVGKPAGWQWFALHLDDERSLMIAEVRGGDGSVVATHGTLVDDAFDQHVFEPETDGVSLDVLEHWTSPHTGGVYPSQWRVKVDSIDLEVLIVPSVADQEIPAMPYGNKGAAYWEGRADVIDTASDERIGLAFVELSGYVDPDPLGWRVARADE